MLRQAWHRCPTCEAAPGWPCTTPTGEPLHGTYHDLDDAVAHSFGPAAGWLVCLDCLDLQRTALLDAHDHCACTRYAVPAPDHVEARLPARSLCIVCATGVAGGPTRWAVLACPDCRAMNTRIAGLMGLSGTGLPLGRHSVMNGAAIRLADGHDPKQAERLAAAVNRSGSLQQHGRARARSLADRHFPDQHGHIPLWQWQQATPPGPRTSLTALIELLGDGLPAHLHEAAAKLAEGGDAEQPEAWPPE